MVKHPDTPIPHFYQIYNAIAEGSIITTLLIGAAIAGILYFSVRHFIALFSNIMKYREFRHSDEYKQLKKTNAEVTLMAIPLTYAMTVNVLFIIGAVFVPGLWAKAEFLFPFSLTAFGLIGLYALKIFSEYFSRLIINGDFDFINNNSLSQLISSFAFAMIAVGFAASAAMSSIHAVSVIGILGAVLFSTISVLLLFIKVVLGFKSIFKQGISIESAPSLWIIIPILTLLGITIVRVTAGVSHNILHTQPSAVFLFIILAFFISFQMIIGLIGYVVLKKTQYFDTYINGTEKSVGSYSIICPGVASFVLGMFFIHWGLVKTGILSMYSPVYFAVLLPLVLIQFKTIYVLSKINRKMA
jgi:hypothetical protein